MSDAEILHIIGNPQTIDNELKEYRKDTRLLSSKRANLLQKYPKQWVAIYGGDVRAHGRTHAQVLAKIDELELPRDRVIVRYIDRNLRRMIL